MHSSVSNFDMDIMLVSSTGSDRCFLKRGLDAISVFACLLYADLGATGEELAGRAGYAMVGSGDTGFIFGLYGLG